MNNTRKIWDDVWGSGKFSTEMDVSELVKNLCQLVQIQGKKILEVGAGRGVDSICLKELGADSTIVDYSINAVRVAKELANKKGVKINIVCADTYKLPFPDESFDLIFHQGLLEHFRDPKPLLEEQIRTLKSDGLLIADVPQKYHAFTLKKHLKMMLGKWPYGWETQYSVKELESLFRSVGLKTIHAFGYGSGGFISSRVRRYFRYISRRIPERLLVPLEKFRVSRLMKYRFMLYLYMNVAVVGRKSEGKDEWLQKEI